jgi:hypothetical protein
MNLMAKREAAVCSLRSPRLRFLAVLSCPSLSVGMLREESTELQRCRTALDQADQLSIYKSRYRVEMTTISP